jgi:hypothetical protein
MRKDILIWVGCILLMAALILSIAIDHAERDKSWRKLSPWAWPGRIIRWIVELFGSLF